LWQIITPVMKHLVSLILLTALFSPSLSFSQHKPLMQQEPAWVTHSAFDYNNTRLDDEAENGYINLVQEKQVSLQQQSVYTRIAFKILSESGVQNGSEINVNFDPSYQQLIFHSIKIIRGKETINKLQPAKIKVIQQEEELNMHLYDGSLSAVLFLEDVRKGDIIEYSYTIKGSNPVFKGKFSGIFETGFSVPVYNLYYKLLVPDGRTVQIKNSLTNVTYETKKQGNETCYEWKLSQVPALHEQDRTPTWYDLYPMVMVSEYKNWKEVNDWAMKLFPFDGKLSAGLQKRIKEIKAAHQSTEQRILAALHFVQDDVRYMGIEMGQNSHRPNSPDKIFAQRFGDCKDKSYLLCTLLRAIGVEANPVMINTSFKKTIMHWLPGPQSFDHVTVRVTYNGRYYWFDPTTSYQRGNIDAISYPNYHCGLVISDSTTSLTTIPLQNKGMVQVQEQFDIPDMSGNARLIVKTVYTGSYADDMREQFNSNSKSEMKKTFREYYARYYERIETDSLSYIDNDTTGQFVTYEYYAIQNFWQLEKGVNKTYFSPYVINGILKKPKDMKRTMPFAIDYPAKYQEEITINVPEEWNGLESMENISCSAFKMRVQFASFYRKFKLKYEYESLKDHVLPNEADAFFTSYKKVDENLEFSLSKTTDKAEADTLTEYQKKDEQVNVVYVIIIVVVLFGGAIWFTQRKR
jgi:transglutaminase-like putative cysteine protease